MRMDQIALVADRERGGHSREMRTNAEHSSPLPRGMLSEVVRQSISVQEYYAQFEDHLPSSNPERIMLSRNRQSYYEAKFQRSI